MSGAIRLPDGRALGVVECGDRHGWPVFFFHGFAGSRLQSHPKDGLAAAAGVRLIALDRPGVGLSDRLPGRRVIDWAKDVAAAADVLKVGQFSVFGWSAGCPHALACAHEMPQRVTSVALASPMGGWMIGPGSHATLAAGESRRLATITAVCPWVLPILLRKLSRQIRHNPHRVIDTQLRKLPASDQAVLADPPIRSMLVDTLGEAFRQGTAGVADDVLACARNWGFDPAAISVPIHLWHGTADRTIPVLWAQDLSNRLPSCHASWLPGDGHFLVFAAWSAILSAGRDS